MNTNVLKSGLALLFRSEKAINMPVHLLLEPTSACNLRCKFCNRDVAVESNKQMRFEEFKNIFDEINPMFLTLSGRGEPLLAKDLTKMVSYARNKGSNVILTTNFTLGKRFAEDFVRTDLNNLRVSIDTALPDTYKELRGADLHSEILEGIDKINSIKREIGSNKPSVGFEVVINTYNLEQCPDIVTLAREYNVTRVNFRILNLMGVEDRADELMGGITKEKFIKVFQMVRKREKEEEVKTNAGNLIRNISFMFNRSEIEKDRICALLWLQAFVNAEGEVAPCCDLNMDEGVSMGNALEKSFREVWNCNKYKRLRHLGRKKKLPYKDCKRCPNKGLKQAIVTAGFLSSA